MNRSMLDYLRKRQAAKSPDLSTAIDHEEPAERMPGNDPTAYQFVLRQKRKQAMLKRILAESGYSDLARMSSINPKRLEEGVDD